MIPSCSSFGSVAQLQHINKIQKQIEQLNDANLNDLYFHGNYHIHSHPYIHTCDSVFVSMLLFSYSLILLEKKRSSAMDLSLSLACS